MRRTIRVVGIVLIAVGLAVLGWIAWDLWGTRLETKSIQRELAVEFDALPPVPDAAVEPDAALDAINDDYEAARSGAGGGRSMSTRRSGSAEPRERAGAVARMRIPKVGLDTYVVAGASLRDLRGGPGMIASTSVPGTPGRSVVAGHRTTYGAEFNRNEELRAGDEIFVDTPAGTTTYRVTGRRVIRPSDAQAIVEITTPGGPNRLILTTCHPKFSARQRLLVEADMVAGPFMGMQAILRPDQIDGSAQRRAERDVAGLRS
jgi:sortase A